MEALPWIRDSQHRFGSDGYVNISGKDTSESCNAKRKVESFFSVMRKRICRHNYVDDDMFPDLDYAEESDGDDELPNFMRHKCDLRFENLLDNPYDPLDEGSIVDSDSDLSESSEFDVVSEHVLVDNDLITGSKSLSIWHNEDEGTLWSSQTLNSIFLLSPDENGVRSKEDDISLFHSERNNDEMFCIPELCEDILRCIVNKEDPEVPYNSDIFNDDAGDKSSAIEVRYGDVVDMHESMEEMCSNNELRLWNKDDEPIPISIVPPGDGWPNILRETCSLYDDNIGLEISPIPLTKTLERHSRPWSVCGSIAAVRNLPLVEHGSGACSSLDEQLYLGSEERDEELAQTPSTLYQEEVDGEDEICFSDIDAMIRKLNLVPDDSDSCLYREEWNMSKHPRDALLGLEQCTRTSMRRAIMSQGAFAVLHGRDSKHFVRKHEVIIGRSSDGLKVDIDLGKYGYGSKISRRQALVKLENNGSFSMKNLGKQHILVDGEKLETGQIVTLTSCSSINIREITFVFKINKEAVRQFLKKNNKRKKSEDNTKFRWCE